MKGLTFWQTIRHINFYKEECIKKKISLKIFVEDPNQIKAMYANRFQKDLLPLLMNAQNVGMNKQIATHIIDYCKLVGIPVEALKPFKGGKVKGPAFEEQTGIKTNQHCRDSYMILVRKNVIPYNRNHFYDIVQEEKI